MPAGDPFPGGMTLSNILTHVAWRDGGFRARFTSLGNRA